MNLLKNKLNRIMIFEYKLLAHTQDRLMYEYIFI